MSDTAQIISFVTGQLWSYLSAGFSQPVYEIEPNHFYWPEADEGQTQLVFYRKAVPFIAERLAQGIKLQQAQNEWIKQTSFILNKQKQNRRLIRLVDADCAAADVKACKKILKGYDVSFAVEKPLMLEPSLEHLVAQQQVLSFSELQRINVQLDASSLPLTDNDAELAQVDAQTIIEKVHANAQQLEDNNAKLKNELKDATEALDKLHATQSELEQQLTQTQQALETKASDHEQLEQQLQQVQKDLENYYVKEQQTQHDKAALAGQLQQTESKLNAANAEKDELAQQLAEAKQARDSKSPDHELLERQLEQVQQDVESYYIKYQQAKYEKNQLAAQQLKGQGLEEALARAQRDIQSKNEKLHSFSQKMKKLKVQLDAASAELQELKNRKQLPAVIEQSVEQTGRQREISRVPAAFLRKLSKPFAAKKKSKDNQTEKDNLKLITESALFDADYYLANNKDVAQSVVENGVNPAQHYLRYGGFEGRKPSKGFDSAWYLAQNKDVAEAKFNPLVHYLLYGQAEGRAPKNNKQKASG